MKLIANGIKGNDEAWSRFILVEMNGPVNDEEFTYDKAPKEEMKRGEMAQAIAFNYCSPVGKSNDYFAREPFSRFYTNEDDDTKHYCLVTQVGGMDI